MRRGGREEKQRRQPSKGILETDVQHQSLYPDISLNPKQEIAERRQHLVSLRLLVNLQNQQFKKKIFKVSTKNLMRTKNQHLDRQLLATATMEARRQWNVTLKLISC